MKNKISTFDELYFASVDPDGVISSFISGHLMVEFILVKIIEISFPKLKDFAEELNHFKLVKLVNGLDLISDAQAEVLLKINAMRNKFAHSVAYRPSVAEMKEIFILAQNNFTDLTDGLIQGIEELEGVSSIEECESYIFSDLFVQISYDLHDIYQDKGGDIIEFKKVE